VYIVLGGLTLGTLDTLPQEAKLPFYSGNKKMDFLQSNVLERDFALHRSDGLPEIQRADFPNQHRFWFWGPAGRTSTIQTREQGNYTGIPTVQAASVSY